MSLRILVTGSNGFIGKRLCARLASRGFELIEHTRSMGDLLDSTSLQSLPSVDVVVHLAGRTFVPDSWSDPAGFVSTNVLVTNHVLEYCRRVGARMIFASAYVYGIPSRLPISEKDATNPNNPYALSKALAEQVCEFYSCNHAVDVTVLRPFNVFGPGQSERFLISKIIAAARAGELIEIEDLAPRRDYIFVDDLVCAFECVIDRPLKGYNVFNIGSGESKSVGEVAEIIRGSMNSTSRVICIGAIRRNEISDTVADIRAAREQLGWIPKVSFVDAIKKMAYEEFKN